MVLARDRNDRSDNPDWVACKIIKTSKLSERMQASLKREISILGQVRSPNVVGFRGIVRSASNVYIFMSFVNGGDL